MLLSGHAHTVAPGQGRTADLGIIQMRVLAAGEATTSRSFTLAEFTGGEGPWNRGIRIVEPGVLIAGLNPVCTDAVAAAVMGYDPRARRGAAPFEKCDNILTLAEAHGVGSTDLRRIDVRGISIEQALYKFS